MNDVEEGQIALTGGADLEVVEHNAGDNLPPPVEEKKVKSKSKSKNNKKNSPGQVWALLADAYMSRKRRMKKVLDEGEERNSQQSKLAQKFDF